MVNLDIYTDPSRYAVQALRSNIVEVEVEVTAFTQKIGSLSKNDGDAYKNVTLK